MEAIFILTAAACLAALLWPYRALKAPFFLYLLAAGLPLAIAVAASCLAAWPRAEALADLGLAAFGIALMAASRQLLDSFRLAEEGYD